MTEQSYGEHENSSAPSERTWSSVEVGETLEGFSMELDWTSLVLQVSGSQDWNVVHHDVDFARDSGHSEPFYNTAWTAAMLGRVVTDWIGPRGWLRSLEFRMRKMNVRGVTVIGRGSVTGKRIEGDEHLVDLDVWLENDREGVTTVATAVVRLPDVASA
jgi:acyl dehydratase